MAEIGKETPQVGMRFRNRDEAWAFWNAYGGRIGFDVRKRYANKSRIDGQGRKVVENLKLEAQLRYQDLSHKFHDLASKIASSPECCLLLGNAIDSVRPQLEDKLNEAAAATTAMNKPSHDKENVDPNVQQANDLLCSAQLKKKEVSSKKLRRTKTWFDKLRKKRKPTKSVAPTEKGAEQKKKDDVQPQVQVENDGTNKGGSPTIGNVKLQEYDPLGSFTELLTAPRVGDLYDYLF